MENSDHEKLQFIKKQKLVLLRQELFNRMAKMTKKPRHFFCHATSKIKKKWTRKKNFRG